jgi:MFS family permease
VARFLDVSLFKRNHAFALLYTGQFISFLGTMMAMVALPFQIYTVTHSTVMVGLLSLVELLPLLFTALMGGVLADRHSRRRLLLISDTILAACCILLAVNAALTPNLIMIFVIASFMSAITGLERPAYEGLVQQMVRSEDYKTVGALRSFLVSFCMITGSAMGGLIIAALGIAVTYWIDFFTFLCSLITLLLLKPLPKPINEESVPVPIFTSLQEGIRFAWSEPVIWGSYCVDFIAMVFAMPSALFPAIALRFSDVKTLGLLYAAPAVGSLLISIWSGWTAVIKREGQAIVISATFWGIAIMGFGLSHSLPLALLFLAVAGAADTVSGIFRMSLWNNTVPPDFRGRLAGIEMLSYLSGPKLGDMRAGWMAKVVGIESAIVHGGLLCVLGVGFCCYRLREFWHYRVGPAKTEVLNLP